MNEESRKVKCVVWDLDHTVWDGVLLEGDTLSLRPGVREAVEAFDQRGILQSVVSKNEYEPAWEHVVRFGLADYFLYPQIGWAAKSASIRKIAKDLNIGLDTFAFIDDQAFERDEVRYAEPSVRAFDPEELPRLLEFDEFYPRFLTEDTARRRLLYQADIARQKEEQAFGGPNDAFLATLDMALDVAPAKADDLRRVEELALRTNQLNTTGKSYDYDELERLRTSPDHRLLVAELTDRYGTYGKIGVVLIHCTPTIWTIQLLLMSCRVMSRGIGGPLITFLRREAKAAGVALRADFKDTGRNRMMYVTYKFSGFTEVAVTGEVSLLENDLSQVPPFPVYLRMNASIY